jgi:hypothetical protein
VLLTERQKRVKTMKEMSAHFKVYSGLDYKRAKYYFDIENLM